VFGTKNTSPPPAHDIAGGKEGAAAPRPLERMPLRTPVPPSFSSPNPTTGGPQGNEQRPRNWDERLNIIQGDFNPLSEYFRTLRTRILHPASGPPPRSLLITSTTPAEGKSFVCANLGISIAQGVEQYALMVDCDLRRPTLGQLFGLPCDHGLSDHLARGVDLASLIQKTEVRKLSIIPAGHPPDNPSELLDSDRMTGLVDELVARYHDRLILLDSPPLQAAAETAILAQQVDGVVLVVRWGAGRREYIKTLIDIVGKEKIVGVVFNAVRTTAIDRTLFGDTDYQSNSYYYKKNKPS